MSEEIEVGPAADLQPGDVMGATGCAVGDVGGQRFAVTRRRRHLGADLADGSIDDDGCLGCPWHHVAYDTATGEMTQGPRGVFAKVPGLGAAMRLPTRVFPLGRGEVTERDGTLFVR